MRFCKYVIELENISPPVLAVIAQSYCVLGNQLKRT